MEAKIYNFRTWVFDTDPEKLSSTLEKLLKDSGFVVLGSNQHFFKPQGYSAVWLISESHLAVHTWPEHGKSYVELSSCNKEKQEKFIRIFKKKFC